MPVICCAKKRSERFFPIRFAAIPLLLAILWAAGCTVETPARSTPTATATVTVAQPSESAAAALSTASPVAASLSVTASEAPTASPASASPATTATASLSTKPAATASPVVTKKTVKNTAKPVARHTAAKKTATPRPSATKKPSATATTPSGVRSEESAMIAMVNSERKAAGLSALTYDASLRAGALKHSQDMSVNGYFSHTSPTYGSFTDRLAAAGIRYTSAGENIAMYSTVERAHEALMNSPGHRANILNSKYARIGIGIVYNKSKGVYYITQWFAK